LTDAYELLITHTNPNNPDTDGSGLPDGWQVLLGLNPLVNQVAQQSTSLNYKYSPADRFNAATGLKNGIAGFDKQANVRTVSQ
jgi:hypothetical protein